MQPKWMALAAAIGFLACSGASGLAVQDKPPAADNTKINARDRSKNEPTADQAKNKTSDLDIMQQIRKAVIADSSLSTYAHNVKIISQHGKVTLKGPVRSEEEKIKIEKMATDVAGAGNVIDQIMVKPTTKKS